MQQTMIKSLRKVKRIASRCADRVENHKQRRNMQRFYSTFVQKGDLCFDVGANIGNRTSVFLDLGAKVVAIEPQTECAISLRKTFGENPNFYLVEAALGESEGEAEMLVGDASVLSSLSTDWVASVTQSGRFADHKWRERRKIELTTIDSLISMHGLPTFIKVDVEGFEYKVVKGLTRPVKFLSFEFTPEFIDSSLDVISYLEDIGKVQFNFSLGESMTFSSNEWLDSRSLSDVLRQFGNDNRTFGDFYAHFLP